MVSLDKETLRQVICANADDDRNLNRNHERALESHSGSEVRHTQHILL